MSLNPNEFMPALKDGIRLKPLDGYAVAHGHHPSLIRMLHPSEAFFLSMCKGEFSLQQLATVFGGTFRLSSEETRAHVNDIVDNCRMFFAGAEAAVQANRHQADPKQFLYKGDDDVLAAAKYGKWPVPAGINITVTFKCNFNCGYCYQDLTQTGRQGWDAVRCLDLIDEAADWGVVFFGLTGGEPTIFKGWLEVVERGLERGMVPSMTSNGTVIGQSPEIAQRLAAAGMEEITISFDALTAAVHDEVTQSKGHLPKVIDAIRYLADAGIRVVIKSVLTPMTQHQIEDMIDFLVTLGVSEIGISYMETGAINSGANALGNVSMNDLQTIREKVAAKQARYGHLCRIHPPKDASKKWNKDEWYPCGGINMGMSIFPTGDVTVCDKMHGVKDFTYGNVFDSGLKEIWDGPAFEALRARTVMPDLIDPDCAKCSKLHQCRTSCFVDSYNATGNYFAKDPNCGGPFFD